MQVMERTNGFLKIYILGFLNFLYLPRIMQQNFFILTFIVIEDIFELFNHAFHIC